MSKIDEKLGDLLAQTMKDYQRLFMMETIGDYRDYYSDYHRLIETMETTTHYRDYQRLQRLLEIMETTKDYKDYQRLLETIGTTRDYRDY